MIVGIMIGAGIFRVPADVAAAVSTEWQALALWALGGLAALTGALTYAELATRFPSIGGEYHFLRLAWGPRVGALDFVTHCYRRPRHLPLWPYSLFAMCHGASREAVLEQVEQIRALLGPACRAHDALFSTAILKKTGLRV